MVPNLAVVAFAVVMLGLVWLLQAQENQNQKNALARDMQWAEQTIRLHTEGTEEFLAQTARDIATGELDQDGFQVRANQFIANNPELANIVWVSPARTVKWSAPFDTTDWLVGNSLHSDQEAAFEAAQERGRPVYGQPYTHPPGRPMFELYVPVRIVQIDAPYAADQQQRQPPPGGAAGQQAQGKQGDRQPLDAQARPYRQRTMIIPPAGQRHQRKRHAQSAQQAGRRRDCAQAPSHSGQTGQHGHDNANAAAARRRNLVRTALPRQVQQSASMGIADRASRQQGGDQEPRQQPSDGRQHHHVIRRPHHGLAESSSSSCSWGIANGAPWRRNRIGCSDTWPGLRAACGSGRAGSGNSPAPRLRSCPSWRRAASSIRVPTGAGATGW